VPPRDVIEANPYNPSSLAYAGMRTSLAFRSVSTELPEHMHSFIVRDFSTLQAVEQVSYKRSGGGALGGLGDSLGWC
jgi:hypothetical protein